MRARVILENGSVLSGVSFGYEGLDAERVCGEVVFNTSMSGYQELLTDPSYKGQIVNLTYPLVGNYGVNEEDNESGSVQVSGLIVREYQKQYSNYRATRSLAAFLQEHKILAVEGIDTRALTRTLRQNGTMMGVIELERSFASVAEFDVELKKAWLRRDLVSEVTSAKLWQRAALHSELGGKALHVVVMDFGVKYNSLRMLEERGCVVSVVPAGSSAEDVLALKPDGVFLSNGPGDPRDLTYVLETVKSLVGCVPLFGICLGYQILGLVLGAKVYKLKFGHRGVNHPLKNLRTGEVKISSQNHGFAVDLESLPSELTPLYSNLNDQTLEGFASQRQGILAVQYHPESSPGPRDCASVFDDFIELMKG